MGCHAKDERLSFSGWRCLVEPSKAEDPKQTRGYLTVGVHVDHLRVELEGFSTALVEQLKKEWTSTHREKYRGSHRGHKSFSQATSASPYDSLVDTISRLLPPLQLLIMVDSMRVVFRSAILNFKRQFAEELRRSIFYPEFQKPPQGHNNANRNGNGTQDVTAYPAEIETVLDATAQLPHLPFSPDEATVREEQNKLGSTQLESIIILEHDLSEVPFESGITSTEATRSELFSVQHFRDENDFDQLNRSWGAQFDVYSPHSSINFYLISCGDRGLLHPTGDETLACCEVAVGTDLSRITGQPQELVFEIPLPFTPISVSTEAMLCEMQPQRADETENRSYRKATVTLTLRIHQQFASTIWKQWPAYALATPVRRPLHSPAYHNIMLLNTCTYPSNNMTSTVQTPTTDSKASTAIQLTTRSVDVKRTLECAELLAKLLWFWGIQLRLTFSSLQSWDRPFLSVINFVGVFLLLVPGWTIGLLLLYLSTFLMFVCFTRPWFQHDPFAEQLSSGLKSTSYARQQRTTFQSDNNEDKASKRSTSSMECLVETLLDSAVPPEMDYLIALIQKFLSRVFPVVVRSHAYLTGYSIPEVAMLYKRAKQLSGISLNNVSNIQCRPLYSKAFIKHQTSISESTSPNSMIASDSNPYLLHYRYTCMHCAIAGTFFVTGVVALLHPMRFFAFILVVGALWFTYFLIEELPLIQSVRRIAFNIFVDQRDRP